MKVLKTIGIVIAILAISFSIYNAFIDPHYEVERSLEIQVEPEVVSEAVSNFKTWPEWSSWFRNDSTMIATYGSTFKGPGGTYSWKSEMSGNGSMEILSYTTGVEMQTAIRFEGFAENKGHWKFEEAATGTKVTWGFSGDMPFFLRFMAPYMDQAVASDFETGLEQLKIWLESKS